MRTDLVLFWVMAPISVGSAVLMLLQRNAVYAALLLIVNFFTLAVFFLLLDAPFLFAVQIIVYAGAIMVLFLFVIMLLGVDRRESLIENLSAQRPLALVLGLGVAAEVFFAVRLGVGLPATGAPNFDKVNTGGNTQALARVLFHNYFFPFEVTSVLLIVAAIAAIVMAGRQSDQAVDDPIAREQATLRQVGAAADADTKAAADTAAKADTATKERVP
jgi:NADH-quinone oxidoreductase subunit J